MWLSKEIEKTNKNNDKNWNNCRFFVEFSNAIMDVAYFGCIDSIILKKASDGIDIPEKKASIMSL